MAKKEVTEEEVEAVEEAPQRAYKLMKAAVVDAMERQALAFKETLRGDGLAEPMLKLIESHRGLQAIIDDMIPDDADVEDEDET